MSSARRRQNNEKSKHTATCRRLYRAARVVLLRVERVFRADVVNVTFRLFNQHIKPLAQIGCDHVHQTEFGDHFVPVHVHRLKKRSGPW